MERNDINTEHYKVNKYLYEIGKGRPVSREEEIRLLHKMRAGDGEAGERLIRAHSYLIRITARRHVGRIRYGMLTWMDLISVGVIGLMDALSKFDATRNVRFSTYAVSRINGAILDEIQKTNTTVYLSRPMRSHMRKIGVVKEQLKEELNHPPDITELVARTGGTVKAAGYAVKGLSGGFETSDFDQVGESFRSPEPDPETLMMNKELSFFIATLINDCTTDRNPEQNERNKEIFCRIHGINGKEPVALKIVGAATGITESRISQIDTKIKKWLKVKLKPYYSDLCR